MKTWLHDLPGYTKNLYLGEKMCGVPWLPRLTSDVKRIKWPRVDEESRFMNISAGTPTRLGNTHNLSVFGI